MITFLLYRVLVPVHNCTSISLSPFAFPFSLDVLMPPVHIQIHCPLKGECHEIFHLVIFSLNNYSRGRYKLSKIVLNFALNSRRYSRISKDSPLHNIAVSHDSALYYIAASQILPLFNIAASQILDFQLKSSAYSRVKSDRYIK